MRRLFEVSVLGSALTLASTVFAQTPQTNPQPSSGAMASSEERRAATTTASGDTGLWFVPTGEVLSAQKWSVSFYRTNIDDGQGFSDVSKFPVTFAVGLGNRAELFGSWALITRIDRDTRPLFFTSAPGSEDAGTGGGILVEHPLVRKEWIGNQLGDLWLGGKFNVLAGMTRQSMAVAARAMVKLPVGDDESGASSGQTDFVFDGVVSGTNRIIELSGYGGIMIRGNPDGYALTNGFRWGVGLGFPQRHNAGFSLTAEVFGEHYFNTTITAPPNLFGSDGSPVPVTTRVESPVVTSLGLTWQAPNGFFAGLGASWNLSMNSREDAKTLSGVTFTSEPKDDKGLQVRIGFHPGVRNRNYVAPPPPPPPAPPPTVAPPAAPANRPPTVTASCNPCTVEVGRTATVTADAQDPDGDPLTYQWTVPAGSLTSPTNRQSPWTAPMQEGPVPFTVVVSDGKGGTARATVTIQVVRPAQRSYTFEDVHFEFDRFSLRPDALRVLDEAVTAMQADPNLRLVIEGHTCNIGTAEYNLALGERRANAVRDYLTSRGIAAERLRTVSYGEERPKFDNAREETRRLNRRAALTVSLQKP